MRKYLIVALLLFYSITFANTWFVHPDSTLNSIQMGLDSCSTNDTVLVASGTYVENIIWPGVDGIKLIGSGRDNCIIDGNNLASVLRFDSAGIDTTTLVRGFTLTNGNALPPWPKSQGGGVYIFASSPIIEELTIIDNTADDFGGGIYIWSSGRPIIRYCVIANNTALSHGGIDCGTGEPSVILDHVTIVGNDPGGAYFSEYALLTNSIVAFNADYGVRVEGSSFDPTSIDIAYSDINDPLQLIGVASVDSLGGIIDENPLFVDYGNNNYQLQQDSPCIDAGDPSYPLDPDSTITDMGAFYYHQTGIQVDETEIIENVILMPIQPNPSSLPVRIQLNISSSMSIRLAIFDISGRLLKIIADREFSAGKHIVRWNGRDSQGNTVDAGIYVCSLETGGKKEVRKFIIVK